MKFTSFNKLFSFKGIEAISSEDVTNLLEENAKNEDAETSKGIFSAYLNLSSISCQLFLQA
jgi:hypothetical protein